MSVQYDKILSSDPTNTLKMNISGFQDGVVSAEDLKFSIYAYNTLRGSSVFRKTLFYEDICELYNYLNGISIIRDNTKGCTNKFIELDEDNRQIINLVASGSAHLLRDILRKVESIEKQELLLNALTKAELNDLGAAIKQTRHNNSLRALSVLLELEATGNIVEAIKTRDDLAEYRAGQPEKIFQNWIEGNTWSLGVEYIRRHSVRKIGINTESDLIMESTDGFIDLIELKRPQFALFAYDQSHSCFYPSKELAKVLGQCLHYLKKLDEYKLNLEKEYKFKVLRPRIKIIIGRTDTFNDEQYEALRMLNSNLTHIQVFSYDYLLSCGETIMSFYKAPLEAISA